MLSHSEFQPGVPWKGVQSPEPEPDPYMSPAGMLGPSVLSDTEHHLLQDNTGTETVSVHVNLVFRQNGPWWPRDVYRTVPVWFTALRNESGVYISVQGRKVMFTSFEKEQTRCSPAQLIKMYVLIWINLIYSLLVCLTELMGITIIHVFLLVFWGFPHQWKTGNLKHWSWILKSNFRIVSRPFT